VATSLTKVKAITADLPSGEKATQAQSSKTPIVNLKGDQIFFNDKPVDMDELRDRLDALKLAEADGNAKVIMLESTRDTPYQSYYQAMAQISESGGVIAIVEEE
jgi:biopolymer transport protein ExbD